jgi:hypothetical protein
MTARSGPTTAAVDQLAERCRHELALFSETSQNDPQPCLELWRLALREHSSWAWQHIIACFTPFLRRKLDHSLLGREVIRRRSHSATHAQAEQSLIEDGFAEMAKGNLRHPLDLYQLGSLLNYLWLCAENLMKMELRRTTDLPLPAGIDPPGPGDPAKHSGDHLRLAQAATALRGCARNEREHRAGVRLILLQYTPQELTKDERYHGEYPDVKELYAMKARLLRCLQAHVDWP